MVEVIEGPNQGPVAPNRRDREPATKRPEFDPTAVAEELQGLVTTKAEVMEAHLGRGLGRKAELVRDPSHLGQELATKRQQVT